ncbi:MAG: lysophospholipid acyltransferase family protein [Pseudomonadota bacterium]
MKSLLSTGPISVLLGWIIWAYMALCGRTIRWTVEGDEAAKGAWAAHQGVVVAAWHSRILLLPAGWARLMRHWPGRSAPSAMMISLSPEGEPVARAIRHLGLESIRGSSSHKRKKKDKGGAQALAAAIRRLKGGGAVCITPDGPRGPAEKAQLGPVVLAQRSGAPILPYALASAPAKRLSTWDRFIIPYPFTKGAIVFGEPILVGRSDDSETVRVALEASLAAATARAEALAGIVPVTPSEHGRERPTSPAPSDS